jgi:predicted DNA-binding transcriptional regulator AlpA
MTQQTNDDLMTAAQVRAHFGGISDMSLWRWERTIGFPKPDAVINRRKFWQRSTIVAWQASQAERQPQSGVSSEHLARGRRQKHEQAAA